VRICHLEGKNTTHKVIKQSCIEEALAVSDDRDDDAPTFQGNGSLELVCREVAKSSDIQWVGFGVF
jgi:hypothetical protein